MITPVLKINSQKRDALDAGFAAAFGGKPERYFPHPAVRRSAVTTPTTSVAVCWRLR